MTSVLGLDEPAVDELCRRVAPFGRLWKANLLGPGNIVVSGDAPALEQHRADRHRARGHEGHPAQGRRCVSLGTDEARRRSARRRCWPRHRSPPRASRFTPTSTPRRTPTPTTSAARSSPRFFRASAGKTRCAGCSPTASTRSTKSGPAASSPDLLKRIDRKIPCTSIPATVMTPANESSRSSASGNQQIPSSGLFLGLLAVDGDDYNRHTIDLMRNGLSLTSTSSGDRSRFRCVGLGATETLSSGCDDHGRGTERNFRWAVAST